MTTKQFTPEQMAQLAAFERYFDQAINARFCSYPGRHNIDTMLALWNEATDSKRTLRMGCGDCLFNLVADLGTLYYAQRSLETASKPVTKSNASPAPAPSKPTPAEPAKAVKMPRPSDYKTAEGFAKAYLSKYALAHPDEAYDEAAIKQAAAEAWNKYQKAKKAKK